MRAVSSPSLSRKCLQLPGGVVARVGERPGLRERGTSVRLAPLAEEGMCQLHVGTAAELPVAAPLHILHRELELLERLGRLPLAFVQDAEILIGLIGRA